MNIDRDILLFVEKQGFVIVSSFDKYGNIHCAAKGIIKMDEKGKVFIIDLYKNKTYKNLKNNPKVTITAINELEFKGYSMQGTAKIVPHKDIKDEFLDRYEEKVIRRISERMIKGVQRGIKHKKHFEAELPGKPNYLIEIDVDKIIDLAPPSPAKKKR